MRRELAIASVFFALAMAGIVESGHGQERHRLSGHTDFIPEIAFSPDGTLLATISHDRTVRLWDVACYRELATLPLDGFGRWIAFTPDGQSLVTHDRNEELQDRQDLTPRDHLIVWDVTSRQERFRVEPEAPEGHQVDIIRRALAPDGETLALVVRFRDSHPGGARRKGTQSQLQRWNLNRRELAAILLPDEDIQDLAFSPNSRWLAAGTRGSIHAKKDLKFRTQDVLIWNLKAPGDPLRLKNAGRFALLFSPDSNKLAAGRFDPNGPSVTTNGAPLIVSVWDMEKRKPVHELHGMKGGVSDLAFSPNNNWLAVCSGLSGAWGTVFGESVELVHLPSGRATVLERDTGAYSLQFSRDGKTLAVGHSTPAAGVKFFDPISKDIGERVYQGEPGTVITRVRYSPDGTRLATVAHITSVPGAPRPRNKTEHDEAASIASHKDWFRREGLSLWELNVEPKKPVEPASR